MIFEPDWMIVGIHFALEEMRVVAVEYRDFTQNPGPGSSTMT